MTELWRGYEGLDEGKYRVTRGDGRDRTGGKHEGCVHFVLDLTHDLIARQAAAVYAARVQSLNPKLAQDLMQMVNNFGGVEPQ